jgi:predicted DNA-binding transcriptional regulator YafY
LSRSERFYQIDQLLNTHKVMTRQALLDALDVSWATLKRDLAFLRDRFNAPIVFDREAGGYRFATPTVGPSYELPGLWFSGEEAYALLTMHQLLTDLEPGLLAPHVAPLLSRLESILGREHLEFAEVANRILLARIGKRRKSPTHFAAVSRSVLGRQRLTVRHYSREKDSSGTRTLSPQRLLFYRNNWYLEAWCHTREALRRFSIDAFESVDLFDEPALVVPISDLDRAFGTSYGVYGGDASNIAVLRFSQAASRWVADEEWHPHQVGKLEADGRYVLQVPYADATELKMDILRHGSCRGCRACPA